MGCSSSSINYIEEKDARFYPKENIGMRMVTPEGVVKLRLFDACDGYGDHRNREYAWMGVNMCYRCWSVRDKDLKAFTAAPVVVPNTSAAAKSPTSKGSKSSGGGGAAAAAPKAKA